MDNRQILTLWDTLTVTEKKAFFKEVYRKCSNDVLVSATNDALLEAGQRDYVSYLPSDVLRNIFKFLGVSDLYNLQFVCKRLATELNQPPFFQTVCKRLDVGPSEYAHAEEAKNICRRIFDLTRPSDRPLFRIENRPVQITGCVYLFDYKDELLVVTDGRKIYNDAGDARVTTEVIICMKIFAIQHGYDVFCGKLNGVTQRWRNIFNGETPIMITEYSRHERPVTAMGVIEAEKLLFTGGADGSIFVWRLSGGEPLKTIPVGADVIVNLKIWRPTVVADGSYFIAAICSSRLHVFHTVYEGTDLRISPCNLQDDLVDVKPDLCVRDDGIRVVQTSSESELFLCHFDGATLRKQQILLHQNEKIITLCGVGTQYSLMEIVRDTSHHALRLFEKSGNVWKPLNSCPLSVSDVWYGTPTVVLCDESWLDGIRVKNTQGPVFLYSHNTVRGNDVTFRGNVVTFFWY